LDELLSPQFEEFKQRVSRNGYVRKFYESIKAAIGFGVVDRIFITGVSSLTLDSLTSGFNIGTHLSLEVLFHNMLVFTEQEVAAILAGVGVIKLAQENEIAPLIEAVEAILLQLSNGDATGFDEQYPSRTSVKAVFVSLLYPTQIYTIHSEYETNRRYIDEM
jgi:hypothetical protein